MVRQSRKGVPRRARIALWVIAGFFACILVAGLVMAGWVILQVHRGWASASWPTCTGTVLSSTVERTRSASTGPRRRHNESSWRYRCHVSYRYTVAGTVFTGTRIRVSGGASSNPGPAEADAARFPAGAEVQVHYNPADPADALLESGLSAQVAPLIVGAAAFCVVPLALGVPVVKRLRGGRVRGTRPKKNLPGEAPSGLPAGSGVRVLDESAARVVLALPAGRTRVASAGWIGAIAIGLSVFLGTLVLADVRAAEKSWRTTEVILVAGAAFVGLIGLAMLAWWARLKFETTEVQARTDELRVSRRLWGLGRELRVALPPGACAALEHDHDDNGEPVFAVVVHAGTRRIKFGLSLSQREKTWVVERLNGLLGSKNPESNQGQG